MVTLSHSESLMSHACPSFLLELWPATCPSQPGSVHSPCHCIPGVLLPQWSRALLGPHFAQCFLLKHKHYECRDLPTGSESSYFHPNNWQRSWYPVHSCPLGSSQCAWTWQDLAVFKKCKHEEERLTRLLQLWQRASLLSSVLAGYPVLLVASWKRGGGRCHVPWQIRKWHSEEMTCANSYLSDTKDSQKRSSPEM